MIDWINEGCKHWGWQMRLLYLGKDGWPSRGVLAKLIEEGAVGASAGKFMQHFPECLDAEALKYNNAVKTLDAEDRDVLFVHYVVIGKGKVKADRMEMPRRTYYDRLAAAQGRLSHALYQIARVPHKMTRDCAEINTVALVL